LELVKQDTSYVVQKLSSKVAKWW